jgi:hypothetical protein
MAAFWPTQRLVIDSVRIATLQMLVVVNPAGFRLRQYRGHRAVTVAVSMRLTGFGRLPKKSVVTG